MRSSYKAPIGNAKRKGINDGKGTLNPGPSDYKIPSIFGHSKKTMAVMMEQYQRRVKLKNVHETIPGVGSYDLIKSMDFAMVKNPSFQMGKSHRESFKTEMINAPGPGFYETAYESASITKRNSPRAFIGDSGRNVMNRTTNFPGPSNYQPFKGLGHEL